MRISLGKGVCGAAANERKTIIVPDVSKFPGHIPCDPQSRSEIDILLGVLDLDSPQLHRFDADDEAGLQILAEVLLPALER